STDFGDVPLSQKKTKPGSSAEPEPELRKLNREKNLNSYLSTVCLNSNKTRFCLCIEYIYSHRWLYLPFRHLKKWATDSQNSIRCSLHPSSHHPKSEGVQFVQVELAFYAPSTSKSVGSRRTVEHATHSHLLCQRDQSLTSTVPRHQLGHMDNCTNLKRKRNIEAEGICTASGITSE
ncbi:unnamed protein product, partial [Bubo scandiacus]